MQEVATSNKAEHATDAIKAALQAVREICRPVSICISNDEESPVFTVLVAGIRDLDQIPGKADVKARPSDLYPWRYSKVYEGVEFYTYTQGGEER